MAVRENEAGGIRRVGAHTVGVRVVRGDVCLMDRETHTAKDEVRVHAARMVMWTSSKYRECVECGTENPHDAPCCGRCGGDLSDETVESDTDTDTNADTDTEAT